MYLSVHPKKLSGPSGQDAMVIWTWMVAGETVKDDQTQDIFLKQISQDGFQKDFIEWL